MVHPCSSCSWWGCFALRTNAKLVSANAPEEEVAAVLEKEKELAAASAGNA